MKKNIILFFLSLFLTLAFIWTGVLSAPGYLVNNRNQDYLERAGGYNTFIHQTLPDDNFKAFVSPSPDLLYSYLVFNTLKSPIVVEIPPYNDYWVNQMVDDKTDTFAYVSYKTNSNMKVKYILYSEDTKPFNPPKEYKLIKSPSTTGTFLLRYLVRSTENISEIKNIRKKIKIYEF